MLRTSCLLLAAAALALAACQSPPPPPPGPLTLKTVHPPAGRCGHQPAAPTPPGETAR